jgi:hypothetical protein
MAARGGVSVIEAREILYLGETSTSTCPLSTVARAKEFSGQTRKLPKMMAQQHTKARDSWPPRFLLSCFPAFLLLNLNILVFAYSRESVVAQKARRKQSGRVTASWEKL